MNQMYYDLLHSSDSPINDKSKPRDYRVRFYDGAVTVASFKFESIGYPDDDDIAYRYRSWWLNYEYEVDEL